MDDKQESNKAKKEKASGSAYFSCIRAARKAALAAGLVAAAYFVMASFGVTCPIKALTGISCAGCGMTRAWLCALKGDFAGAFDYHPLFWTVPLLLGVYAARTKIGAKTCEAVMAAAACAYLAVYICRMLSDSGDIVVFSPQDGLVWKAAKWLISLMRQ